MSSNAGRHVLCPDYQEMQTGNYFERPWGKIAAGSVAETCNKVTTPLLLASLHKWKGSRGTSPLRGFKPQMQAYMMSDSSSTRGSIKSTLRYPKDMDKVFWKVCHRLKGIKTILR